jgi:hypothetical protein
LTGFFTVSIIFNRFVLMDDFKLWFYVIIGVIYVISRIIKKSGEQTGSGTPDVRKTRNQPEAYNTTTQSTKPKQLTFEELLREISESKTVQQPSRPAPKPAYVDYDDDLEEEQKSLEKIPYDYRKDDRVYEVYEEAKKQAFERPSLERTLKLSDTDTTFGRFKIFEEEEQRNLLEEYTRDFQNPEGVKRAFVVSEILKRRF